MKQITEDYVSFEIAKLLKEKGFVGNRDIGCKCGFYSQNIDYPNQIDLVYDDLDNSELEHNECLRPTHQMVLKWLREVHNVLIHVNEYGYPNKEKGRQYTFVAKIRNMKSHIDITQFLNDSYEEAIEAAIDYVLKNLI